MLVLLDLSAAFDTVDHNILLERLENWVGLSGMVLKWFRSYLEGRGYYVSIGEHKSKWTSMTCRVPQGSILAPLLFSLYMLLLSQIMRKNQIAYHSYADDAGFWLEPENLSISHQSSVPYTGHRLHLGLILKYFYSFINHSMAKDLNTLHICSLNINLTDHSDH